MLLRTSQRKAEKNSGPRLETTKQWTSWTKCCYFSTCCVNLYKPPKAIERAFSARSVKKKTRGLFSVYVSHWLKPTTGIGLRWREDSLTPEWVVLTMEGGKAFHHRLANKLRVFAFEAIFQSASYPSPKMAMVHICMQSLGGTLPWLSRNMW